MGLELLASWFNRFLFSCWLDPQKTGFVSVESTWKTPAHCAAIVFCTYHHTGSSWQLKTKFGQFPQILFDYSKLLAFQTVAITHQVTQQILLFSFCPKRLPDCSSTVRMRFEWTYEYPIDKMKLISLVFRPNARYQLHRGYRQVFYRTYIKSLTRKKFMNRVSIKSLYNVKKSLQKKMFYQQINMWKLSEIDKWALFLHLYCKTYLHRRQ